MINKLHRKLFLSNTSLVTFCKILMQKNKFLKLTCMQFLAKYSTCYRSSLLKNFAFNSLSKKKKKLLKKKKLVNVADHARATAPRSRAPRIPASCSKVRRTARPYTAPCTRVYEPSSESPWRVYWLAYFLACWSISCSAMRRRRCTGNSWS